MHKLYNTLIVSILFFGCSTSIVETQKKLEQARIIINYELKDSNIYFNIKNTLHCPVRISLNTSDKNLVQKFDTLILQSRQDSVYIIKGVDNEKVDIQYNVAYGDLKKEIRKEKLLLPFSKNKSYKIIQGHNGSFSHNNDGSRFALDFNLKTNDIVKSADDGFVIENFDQFDV